MLRLCSAAICPPECELLYVQVYEYTSDVLKHAGWGAVRDLTAPVLQCTLLELYSDAAGGSSAQQPAEASGKKRKRQKAAAAAAAG